MKTTTTLDARGILQRLSKVIVCTTIALLLSSYSRSATIIDAKTDKALYSPGNTVNFSVTTSQSQSGVNLRVKYYKRMTVLSTVTVAISGTSANWSWTAPSTDNQGYLVSIELMNGSTVLDLATIGVNVATDYKKFPVYGFLSDFSAKSDWDMDVQMEVLNRYHINVIQYYDWMDTHHKPLAGTPSNPSASWRSIANNVDFRFETVKGYIDRGHNNYNMRSMFYDLIYGSYAYSYFPNSWYLYKNQAHTINWSISMPSGWETSAIDMMNCNDSGWRNYFLSNINDVYNATNLHFDGWHVDQLGDWGYMYNSSGQRIDVAQTFPVMLQAAKNARPDKSLIMNAVNTYGQSLIGYQNVDLLYTEMWTNNETYARLGYVIQDNENMFPGKKNVLAAYVNKGRSDGEGTFSDGSVLLCDATIFAFGGMHIELGEHMLCNEYFPNSNLSMSTALQSAIKTYYDFAVAYENILRDGRSFNSVTLSGTGAQYWPPVIGKIATVGANWGGNQVFHCINYKNVNNLNWRDDQPTPTTLTNISMSFPYSTTITRMWVASPDVNKGVPKTIAFTQSNGIVSFKLPSLKYWTMVVAETANGLKSDEDNETVTEVSSVIGSEDLKIINTPGETLIRFSLLANEKVQVRLYDIQGHSLGILTNSFYNEGVHELSLKNGEYKSGLYICQMLTKNGTKSSKLLIR